MGFERRVGAAVRAFMNPALRQPRPIPPPEPTRIGIDRLLAGRKVLVTGAGRNIGRSIAMELLAHGAAVYCTELDPNRCAALETDLAQAGGLSKVYRADIAKTMDTDAILQDLAASNVVIDLLVNNVGVVIDDLSASFATNVIGPVHLTERIAKAMIDRQIAGSILFLSSIHQDTVFTRTRAYAPTKAAIAMLIKQLAVELAPHRIRVNGIAPGDVRLDEQGQVIDYGYTPLEGTSIPPQYIARAAVYLSADYFSRYTTGTILKIDAGLSLFNYQCAFDAGLFP